MSERGLRSKSKKTTGLRRRLPSSVSSPLHRPRNSTLNRRLPRVLERCLSEPMICTAGVACVNDDRSGRSEVDDVFSGPGSLTDVFVSSPLLIDFSPRSFQGFEKEAKVVVNVTVEGSPGPLRTMVKLGSSVEDTIKLVLDKYCGEGRTPKLEWGSASSFELHHSYFSLQCLDNSEMIGDVGSRSFYLRRRKGGAVDPALAKICPATPAPPVFLFPSFISLRFGKSYEELASFGRYWFALVEGDQPFSAFLCFSLFSFICDINLYIA